MNKLTHYRFQSLWLVGHPAPIAYEALRDVASYAQWWPEIREVTELSEDRFRYRVRSLLPYWLEFVSERTIEDPVNRVLEAKLIGELNGFSRFTISPRGESSQVLFEEEVDTAKRSLNLLAPIARPAFRANHLLMMRHGERGLSRYLAAKELRPSA